LYIASYSFILERILLLINQSIFQSISVSIIYQHRYNTVKSKEQKCVNWTERLKKHLQLP